MKHKVKVTVLDKKLYPELQQQYCADPASGARAVLRGGARLPRVHDADAGPLDSHPLAADCAAGGALHVLPHLRCLGPGLRVCDGCVRRVPMLVHRRPGGLRQPARGQ